MRIAVAAPATLSLLQPHVGRDIRLPGYPFPGTSLLIEEYLRQGHKVTLVTTSPGLAVIERFEGSALTIRVVPSRVKAQARATDLFRQERRAIESELRSARPDVCHAHWTYEFALAAQATDIPLVVTIHDWAPLIARQNRHPYWRFRAIMQRRCLRRRGLFTVPSPYLAEFVRSRQPDVRIIPNGVDLRAYPAALPPLASDPVVSMLNVGFSYRKNVKLALRAWPLVRARVPSARLMLAGPDYEPGGSANCWARTNKLSDGVEFVGPLGPEEVPAFLQRSRCFLHSSLEESFGIAVVEALAAGVPVVVGANAGALPDIVGEAGVLVDITNPEPVATATASVLGTHEDELKSRRLHGMRIAAQFDIRHVAKEYLDLLSAVAQGSV